MTCWKCDIPVGETHTIKIVADMYCKCGHEWEATFTESLVHLGKRSPDSHQFTRPDRRIFLWCPACGAEFSFVTLPCGEAYAFDMASIAQLEQVEVR